MGTTKKSGKGFLVIIILHAVNDNGILLYW